MSKKILISVIIPAYKAEKYIRESLDSIAAQTYKNWHVIVVEDCWKDGTEKIVEEFSHRVGEEKVSFVRNAVNKGLAETRNVGLSLAKGEYVALLDHDDLWHPTYLENSVNLLIQSGAGVSYSSTRKFSEFHNDLGIWGPTDDELKNFPKSLFQRNYITPSATIIKKNILDEINGFDSSIRSCEDYDCWIRIARRGEKFVHVPGGLCLYRQHHKSLTKDSKMMAETLRYVVEKHSDWSAIPDVDYKIRMAAVYSRLSNAYSEEDFWKSFNFSIQAWLQNPTEIKYLKGVVRAVKQKV